LGSVIDRRALLNRVFSHAGWARRQFFRGWIGVGGHDYGKMRAHAKLSNLFLTISPPA
jgi:hypothetical protein